MRAFFLILAFCVSCSPMPGEKCQAGLLCDRQTLLNVLLLWPRATTKYIVSSSSTGNTLSVFAVDANTGALKLAASTSTNLSNPASLAYRAASSHLYVVNTGNATITTYYLDPGTGSLTFVSSTGVPTAQQIAIHPAQNVLYVTTGVSGGISSYSLANGTPGFLATTATGSVPSGIALDQTGRYLYTSSSTTNQLSTYAVDSSGALSTREITTPCASDFITVSPGSRSLFASCNVSNQVAAFFLNEGGTLSLANFTTTSGAPRQIATGDGQTILVAHQGLGFYAFSGSLTQVGLAGTVMRNGVAVDYSGRLAWTSQAGAIETFSVTDPNRVALSTVSASGSAGFLLPIHGY